MAVVCGSTASAACNGNPVLESDPNELHEVRCCSDTNLGGGWMKKSGCNVWGESDPAGVCNSEKTFDEAFEICNAVGARLCTKEELLADCTRGTGKFIQIVHSVSLYHHCKPVSYQRLYCFPLLSTLLVFIS